MPKRSRHVLFVLLLDSSLLSSLFPYTTLFRSISAGNGYKVYAVRWPVFGGVTAEGLLLEPDTSPVARIVAIPDRSEEHTSELQSHSDFVCRLLLEKKKMSLIEAKAVWKRTDCS